MEKAVEALRDFRAEKEYAFMNMEKELEEGEDFLKESKNRLVGLIERLKVAQQDCNSEEEGDSIFIYNDEDVNPLGEVLENSDELTNHDELMVAYKEWLRHENVLSSEVAVEEEGLEKDEFNESDKEEH